MCVKFDQIVVLFDKIQNGVNKMTFNIVKIDTVTILVKFDQKLTKLFYKVLGVYSMFNRHANVQHIDLTAPLFGKGEISKDLQSISIAVSLFFFISRTHLQT